MDEANDLKYVYQDEYVDIQQADNGMGEFIWMDLEYVKNGQTIKVPSWPQTDISSFAELDYYQKNWEAHKQQVYAWLEWFQDYVQGMMNVDEGWIKENDQERWDNEEIDHDDYEDFEDYWDKYYGSQGYWEEVSWMQQQAWDDMKNEMEYEVKVIDGVMSGNGWFDSYDNLNSYKMDDGLNDAFEEVEEMISDFLSSEYDSENFDEEELKEHFDEIFE